MSIFHFWHVTLNTGKIAVRDYAPSSQSYEVIPAICNQPGFTKLPDMPFEILISNDANPIRGFFYIVREGKREPYAKCVYCSDPKIDADIFGELVDEYRKAVEGGIQLSNIIWKPPTPWLAVLRWEKEERTDGIERAVFYALANGARNGWHVSMSD